MSHLGRALILSSLCLALPARADRVAVLAVETPGAAPLLAQAEHVAAVLSERGHRVITPAEAASRISSGISDAGAEWAARQLRTIDTARAALTRLDRRAAGAAERLLARELITHGGGAAGSELLVEWCLLEHELAATGGDAAAARLWLDRAVAMGPRAALDAARHPTDEVEQLERRRSVLLSETPATLSILTNPPAADVWIDGVRRCPSPCSVKLVAGRHVSRVSLGGYAPAILDLTLGPGTDTVRQITLPAGYNGAGTTELGARLADPGQRAEAANALEPMARYLEVEHVVALVPEPQGAVRVVVAPPAAGRSRLGSAVSERELDGTVLEQLRPTGAGPYAAERQFNPLMDSADPSGGRNDTRDGGHPRPKDWYAKPGTWIAAGATVAMIVGAVLVYGATSHPQTGTLTISSPP